MAKPEPTGSSGGHRVLESMLFASFDFLLFLLPVLGAYWLFEGRSRLQLILVVLASYFFYAASSKPTGAELPTPWYFVGLLIASTLTNYGCSLLITRAREVDKRGTFWLGLSVVFNVGLLGYFKYTHFLFEVAGDVSNLIGSAWMAPTLRLVLPIGISFYSFQSLSYTIDVWRGRLRHEQSFLNFAVYLSFFPQLVAGPIVRAADFLPQLRARRSLDSADVDAAVYRILKGLIKKVLLGDFVAASFTDIVFSSPKDFSSVENLLALYAFTLQIYADFSGYTDIAIGVARLMGFQLPENFDRPYQAASVGEFWRRWHMTLSTWLRDYVYLPLGGNRLGSGRAYLNLWLTMVLIGMWHGASWNFVIYSNLHAGALMFARWRRRRSGSFFEQLLSSLFVTTLWTAIAAVFSHTIVGWNAGGLELTLFFAATTLGLCLLPSVENAPFSKWFHVFLTFHFSVLSRVFFRADDLGSAAEMVRKLAVPDGHGIRPGMFRLHAVDAWLARSGAYIQPLQPALHAVAEWGLLILIVSGLLYHFTPARWVERAGMSTVSRLPALGVAGVLGLFVALLMQLMNAPRPNIYFAF